MMKDDGQGGDFARRVAKKGGVKDGMDHSSFPVRLDAALLKVAGIFGKGVAVNVDDGVDVGVAEVSVEVKINLECPFGA